jgi:sugar-specific transcriptional regulator TrmB
MGNPSSAAEVAKRTKQHRSNVYDALKILKQKGFIVEVIDEGKKLFEAKNSKVLLNYVYQKESEVRDIIPILNSLTRRKVEDNIISISHGVTKCRNIFYDILNMRNEFVVWGVHRNLIKEYLEGAFLKELGKERIKRKVFSRLLYTEYFEEIEKIYDQPYQEIRYIDSKQSNTLVTVSGNVIFFIIFGKSHNGNRSSW